MKKLAGFSLLLFSLSPGAGADDDYFTTDFQYKLNTRPGFYGFYDYSQAILGDGVSGSSVVQKFGFDVSVIDRLDLYFVETNNSADLARSNRYQFSFYSRAIGARFQVLQEEWDGVGLTAGISYEEAFPGSVIKNGADLLITSPEQQSTHGFLLASKKVTDNLRLNAGVKAGTAIVGPTRGASYNWSLGAEYEFDDNWSVQGNFKQIHLEGLPSNNDLALRINYKPTPDVRIQLHGDYYTRGLESQYPVLQPLIPADAWQRFGQKPQVMLGINASFSFGVESEGRARAEKAKQEKENPTPPADSGEPKVDSGVPTTPAAAEHPAEAVATAPVRVELQDPPVQAAPVVPESRPVVPATVQPVALPAQPVRTVEMPKPLAAKPKPKQVAKQVAKASHPHAGTRLVRQVKIKKAAAKPLDDDAAEFGKAEDLSNYHQPAVDLDDE